MSSVLDEHLLSEVVRNADNIKDPYKSEESHLMCKVASA